MGAQPGSEQGPEAFHGVDVDLMEAVAVFIASVFAFAVTDSLVLISPFGKTGVDIIFIGMDPGASGDQFRDDGLDGSLLNIGKHPKDRLPSPLDQPQNRRLLFLERASARRAFEPSAPPFSAFFGRRPDFPCALRRHRPRQPRPHRPERPQVPWPQAPRASLLPWLARRPRSSSIPGRSAGWRGSSP